MKYTKTASGKWHTQVYLGKKNGKAVRLSVTADTKRECQDKVAALRLQGIPEETPRRESVGQCIDKYIQSSETLSPTTLAGYRKIRRTMFAELMEMDVSEVDSRALQKAINAESRRQSRRGHNISPKSIRNAYGLVSAALRAYYDKAFTVKLPEPLPKFLELPEVDYVITKIQGSEIELQCMLALWLSLSMSEVRGLKYSSLRNGCIYIDQVVVDVDGVPVEKKRAKVATRNRILECPEYILQLIESKTDYLDYKAGRIFDGYICPEPQYTVRRKLEKICPGITFHQLRHLNASVMLQLNVPEKYAMERGGWSTPHTMKAVYQHTFSSERRRVDAAIDEYFSQKVHKDSAQKTAKR